MLSQVLLGSDKSLIVIYTNFILVSPEFADETTVFTTFPLVLPAFIVKLIHCSIRYSVEESFVIGIDLTELLSQGNFVLSTTIDGDFFPAVNYHFCILRRDPHFMFDKQLDHVLGYLIKLILETPALLKSLLVLLDYWFCVLKVITRNVTILCLSVELIKTKDLVVKDFLSLHDFAVVKVIKLLSQLGGFLKVRELLVHKLVLACITRRHSLIFNTISDSLFLEWDLNLMLIKVCQLVYDFAIPTNYVKEAEYLRFIGDLLLLTIIVNTQIAHNFERFNGFSFFLLPSVYFLLLRFLSHLLFVCFF